MKLAFPQKMSALQLTVIDESRFQPEVESWVNDFAYGLTVSHHSPAAEASVKKPSLAAKVS